MRSEPRRGQPKRDAGGSPSRRDGFGDARPEQGTRNPRRLSITRSPAEVNSDSALSSRPAPHTRRGRRVARRRPPHPPATRRPRPTVPGPRRGRSCTRRGSGAGAMGVVRFTAGPLRVERWRALAERGGLSLAGADGGVEPPGPTPQASDSVMPGGVLDSREKWVRPVRPRPRPDLSSSCGRTWGSENHSGTGTAGPPWRSS